MKDAPACNLFFPYLMVIILLLVFTITTMLTAANRENILLPNNLQDGGEAKREKSSQPTQFTWKPALEHLGSMLS